MMQQQHIQPQPLKVRLSFVFWFPKKQDKVLKSVSFHMCFFYRPGSQHRRHEQILLYESHEGYHSTRSTVPLRYRSILFTFFRWDSLGHDWNLAHRPTLNTISSLLAVRYRRDLIILLYFVSFTWEPVSSLSSFVVVPMGVSIVLASFIWNFFSNSFMYFCRWIAVPDGDCLIWRPRKKFSPPIMLISNSLLINFENSTSRSSSLKYDIIYIDLNDE